MYGSMNTVLYRIGDEVLDFLYPNGAIGDRVQTITLLVTVPLDYLFDSARSMAARHTIPTA